MTQSEKQTGRTAVADSGLKHEANASDRQKVNTRIVDLSERGARLITDRPLDEGARLSLRMRSGLTTLGLTSIVRWTKPQEGSGWCVGCEFENRLDPDFLNCLQRVDSTVAQQNTSRHPCDVSVNIRREQDGSQTLGGRIVDYSAGGVCVVGDEAIEPGESVRLELDGSDEGDSKMLFARVQWSSVSEGKTRFGCCFIQQDDFRTFCRATGLAMLPPAPTVTEQPKKRWFGRAATVASGLAVILGLILLAKQENRKLPSISVPIQDRNAPPAGQ